METYGSLKLSMKKIVRKLKTNFISLLYQTYSNVKKQKGQTIGKYYVRV